MTSIGTRRIRRAAPLVPLIVMVSLTAGCAAGASRCGGGESRWQSDTLYFGASRPEGEITATDWKWFLDTEITPRFPEGLSWWAASGQWRDKAGIITREPSYVLQLLHKPDTASDSAVRELIARYESDFQQESVLRVRQTACVSF